jgi:NADH-quinone oxidoreductase subunit N
MDFTPPAINFLVISPVLFVAAWGVILMVVEMFLPREKSHWLGWLALAGLLPPLVQSAGMWGFSGGTFTPQGGQPMVVVDNFSHFLNIVFLLTGILTVLISLRYLRKAGIERGEYYLLMLFSISGMMLMGIANDLILVFLALELLSIPLYILCGFARPRPESEESAMKYFLMGAFSSSFFILGVGLIYGATGSTALPVVLANVAGAGALGTAGLALLLVGFAFKVAAVPFHMWTPDVYEGAPTAVTAFMSVGAKVGGFAAMLRVFVVAFPELGEIWVPAIAVIAAFTMILGNVVALAQENIKRMLAYSSIAHAGYILMAVAASLGSPDGVSAALFYMFAYLFTNLGAFAVVIAVERANGLGVMLDDYKGLARRSPMMALVLAFFMLSLTGIPPTGGFTAKFFVFRTVLEADLLWLALIGIVTSLISAYFYLRVVYLAFMFEGEGEVLPVDPALNTAVAVTVFATLVLGILPAPWFELARQATLTAVHIAAGG